MSAKKPTRNELTMWVVGELYNLRLRPVNPADIALVSGYGRTSEKKIRNLAEILSAMVPHADNGGTLDYARELWSEYEREYNPKESE